MLVSNIIFKQEWSVNPIIEVNKVSKSYSGNQKVLKDVSFTVGKGERLSLLGPNGAGKSTLIRILCSLSTEYSGTVRICGIEPAKNFHSIMRYIGVCGQNDDLDPDETALHHLIIQARLFGLSLKDAKKRSGELVESFKLNEDAYKKTKELSGGNRKRLHCALSLIHKPNLIFLDEPTTGMDPEIRNDFWNTLTRVNQDEGTTLFFCTQYLEEAQRHAKRTIILFEGTIVYDGAVSELSAIHASNGNSNNLEDAYIEFIKKQKTEVSHAS